MTPEEQKIYDQAVKAQADYQKKRTAAMADWTKNNPAPEKPTDPTPKPKPDPTPKQDSKKITNSPKSEPTPKPDSDLQKKPTPDSEKNTGINGINQHLQNSQSETEKMNVGVSLNIPEKKYSKDMECDVPRASSSAIDPYIFKWAKIARHKVLDKNIPIDQANREAYFEIFKTPWGDNK